MKKLSLLVMSALITSNVSAQQTISARITPNVISSPTTTGVSNGKFYGNKRLSFDAGVQFNHQLNSRIAAAAGIDIGVVDWNLVIDEVDPIINSTRGFENYFYNAATIGLHYKLPLGKDHLIFFAGSSFRYYHMETDPSGLTVALGEANDPDYKKVDLLISPAGNKLHLNFPISVDYAFRVSETSSFNVGIRTNLPVSSIGKGEYLIINNGTKYTGEFSPTSRYIGLNVQFDYALEKLRRTPVTHTNTRKRRKALFAEYSGNGLGFTGNFDLRFIRNRNDGFGMRGGIGLGAWYLTNTHSVNRYVALPLTVNHIYGNKRSGVETGFGITPQFAPVPNEFNRSIAFDGFINLGYRLQPINNGFLFRAVWCPSINEYGLYTGTFGISAGYSFK